MARVLQLCIRSGGVVIAAAALILASLHAPTAAVAATAHELRVITHNIAGGPKAKGDLAALDAVEIQIEAYSPDVVMMQEVCGSQYEEFQSLHPTWSVHYAVMLTNQNSCTGAGSADARQGQVLASPYPISAVTIDELGEPQNRPDQNGNPRWLHFTLLCGDVAIPGHATSGLRACTTHLRGGSDAVNVAARAEQLGTFRSLLHDRIWTQGQAVTVGGDLNAWPNWDEMDNLYRLTKDSQYTGIGDFYEADQTDTGYFSLAGEGVACGPSACRTGQYTTSSTKIDYLFISRNVTQGGQVSGGRALPYGSDHYLYRGLFEIQY